MAVVIFTIPFMMKVVTISAHPVGALLVKEMENVPISLVLQLIKS
jgi:hypothetical protein